MKTNKDDVAFPAPDTVATQILGGYGFPQEYMGLTKREYFSAMAMQGLSAHPFSDDGEMLGDDDLATQAVNNADALIRILNLKDTDDKTKV